MTKDELTEAFRQLGRGHNVAADLAEHFMPEPQVVVIEYPFPSAEDIDAMKAMGTEDK